MVLEVMIPCQAKTVLLLRGRSYSKCSYHVGDCVTKALGAGRVEDGGFVANVRMLDTAVKIS